jgi:hypothetical protein
MLLEEIFIRFVWQASDIHLVVFWRHELVSRFYRFVFKSKCLPIQIIQLLMSRTANCPQLSPQYIYSFRGSTQARSKHLQKGGQHNHRLRTPA